MAETNQPSKEVKKKSVMFLNRGPHIQRAAELEQQLEEGAELPFDEIVWTNIGDAQAMGQPPITFARQTLMLCLQPSLLGDSTFPEDTKRRARLLLQELPGASLGAEPLIGGLEVVRRDVAAAVSRRDGGSDADWQDVVLCAGASQGIEVVLELLAGPYQGSTSGVMTPVPQYSLYASLIRHLDLLEISYYLDESANWGLDVSELERALAEARARCTPRALVVINPGNPTGQVLSRSNIEAIVKFAHRHRLMILADEVYEENVYDPRFPFHSFRKVMLEMEEPYNSVPLASFMSISKGFMGECGMRGGYVCFHNVDTTVVNAAIELLRYTPCPTPCQVLLDCAINSPQFGDPSYELFVSERSSVLDSLSQRARLVTEFFNSLTGMSCCAVRGSMFCFPRVHLPAKAIAAAKAAGQAPDLYYAYHLVERTGIVVLPGSFFGQQPGTYHFRMAILPPLPKLHAMTIRFREFHENFVRSHQ